MFSSHFMLFPTFLEKKIKKKFKIQNSFSFLISFTVLWYFQCMGVCEIGWAHIYVWEYALLTNQKC